MSKWEEKLKTYTQKQPIYWGQGPSCSGVTMTPEGRFRWVLVRMDGVAHHMDFWDQSVVGVSTKPIAAGEYLRIGPDGNIRLKQSVVTEDEDPQIEEDICDEAKRITTGDRQNQYGPPDEDFRRTAGMLNSLFADKLREGFLPHEISMIMACLKLSRMSWSPTKRDHHVDLAGYSRTGWLCVQAEIENGEL